MSILVIIGRAINGISLNGLEYLLEGGPDGEIQVFESQEAAEAFLVEQGATEEDLEYFVFQEVMEGQSR